MVEASLAPVPDDIMSVMKCYEQHGVLRASCPPRLVGS
jgi:hypothetical protein